MDREYFQAYMAPDSQQRDNKNPSLHDNVPYSEAYHSSDFSNDANAHCVPMPRSENHSGPKSQSENHSGKKVSPFKAIPQNSPNNKTDAVVTPCTVCAKVVAYITGIYNILAGLFLVTIVTYIYSRDTQSSLVGEDLLTVSTGIILFVGVFALLYSVILIVAICKHTKRLFKLTLNVLCLVLTVAILTELSAFGLSIWSHDIIANPKLSQGDPLAAVHLHSLSKQIANATYARCCFPVANATMLDDACLWPHSMYLMQGACSGSTVLTCVCEKGVDHYTSLFAIFLQHSLTSVATLCMASGLVHLCGLIAICMVMHYKPKNIPNDEPSISFEYRE